MTRCKRSVWSGGWPVLAAGLLCASALAACAAADDPPAGGEKPAGGKAAAEKTNPEKPLEPQSLLYVDPFDEVTLDADNNNAVLKVFPIDFPNRRVPKAPQPTDTIEVRLKEHPDQTFEIAWKSIKRVKLFEQMLMEAAADLAAAGQYDEAYEFYELLEQKYPQTAGVKQAIDEFLWTDALDSLNRGNFDQGLALLVELDRRGSKHAGLAETYAKTTARLIEQAIKQRNYRAARGWLKNLAERYPDDSAATIQKYEAQLSERAAALKAKAESQWKAKQVAQAWRSAAAMLDVWPGIAGGVGLAKEIQAAHPTVVIGVSGFAAAPTSSGKPAPAGRASADDVAGRSALVLDDWALRRERRLLQRQLVEIQGPGPTGASYLAPLASIERRPQLAFRLRSVTPGVRSLTASDVADCLVRLTDPGSPAFDPAWAALFVGAKIEGIDALVVDLRGSQTAAEGWLTQALSAQAASDPIVAAAPFVVAGRSAGEVRYTANPKYALAEPGGPREIVERFYDDSTAALVALRSGQISVIGRLSPWDAPVARAADDLAVEAYAFPTVHVLVPNRRKGLTANRTFRRAVEYALDRGGILNRALLAGRTVAGSQQISGPFPQAADKDPHGYAYDSKVVPRPYDPHLARLLVASALGDGALAESGAKPAKNAAGYLAGPLVLVHPPDPTAEVAAQSIRRQLQAVGIDVTLREAGPDDTLGEFDLAYVELAMQEPIVDVWRLLGPGGLGGLPSAYLEKALAELLAASDWTAAGTRLKAIHRLVADEVDVIPLWQLVEHLAHTSAVTNLGQRPVTLYDHVENWQIELKAPTQ